MAESPKVFLKILLQHRALFIGVALFIWAWMLVYTLFGYHPKYTSQGMLLIRDSAITDRYVLPDQNYAISTTSSSSSSPVLNTMGLLKSQQVSDALWQYFLEKHPDELQKRHIATQLQWEGFFANGKNLIKTKNEPGTDLIQVQLAWTNPIEAKEGLGTVLKALQDTSLDVNRAEQINRKKYLEQQVKQLEDKLNDVRQKKSTYKSEKNISNLVREGDDLATASIDLATRLNQLEAEAQGKEMEYGRYRKMLHLSSESAMTASALGMNDNLNKLHTKYYELSQTYASMKTTLTDKNPRLQALRSQMEQVEKSIQDETGRTLGQAKNAKSANSMPAVADIPRSNVINQMVTAQAESIRLHAEAEMIKNRLKQVDTEIQALPTMEQSLNTLEDQERSLSSALSTLRQKQLEAQIKEADTLSNIFIINNPSLPIHASFPGQPTVLLMGFVLGLAGAIAAVALRIKLFGHEPFHYILTATLGGHAPSDVETDNWLTDFMNKQQQDRGQTEESTRNDRLKLRLLKELKAVQQLAESIIRS
jgi:uncharacterized protein involved in exopolysaccharide biosynthesis